MLHRRRSAVPFLIAALLGLLTALPVAAQVVADPGDILYRHLDVWEKRGLTGPLPYVRPYPVAVVERALRDVVRRGDAVASRLASSYLQEFARRGLPLLDDFQMFGFEGGAHGRLDGKAIAKDNESTTAVRYTLGGEASAAGWILPPGANPRGALSYASEIGLTMSSEPSAEIDPVWTAVRGGTADGGLAVDFLGQTYEVDVKALGTFAVGTDRLYFQAGLSRTAYGPIPDRSVVIGPQAAPAGHFSLVWMNDWLEADAVFLELNAQYAVAPDGTLYALRTAFENDLQAQNVFPSKYLMLHSYRMFPTPAFSLGFIQAVVYGGRTSPIYFLPFPSMFAQVYGGDYDNSLMGLTTAMHFPWDVHLESVFYVDDWNSNQFLKGTFLTAQSKFAWHSRLSWTPQSIVTQVSASHLMISPYMYTHFAAGPLNYLMYTGAGQSLGAFLEPNSDLWELRVDLLPLPFLDSHLFARVMRHANASAGTDTIVGDGSIWDDGWLAAGGHVFGGPWNFLAQEDIMTVRQFGIAARVHGRFGNFAGSVDLSYTLETVSNRDLDPSAAPETNQAFSVSVSAGL